MNLTNHTSWLLLPLVAATLLSCAQSVGTVSDASRLDTVPLPPPVEGGVADVPMTTEAGLVDTPIGPSVCSIAGQFSTNSMAVSSILFTPEGRYATVGFSYQGTYTFNNGVLTLMPLPGPVSDCPGRFGASYRISFSPDCARVFPTTLTDDCTGAGLLTQASVLTRM